MKNRTKIAILVDYLIEGGVQKSAIAEALNLKKLGFETTIIILAKSKGKIPDKGRSAFGGKKAKSLNIEYLYDKYPSILKNNFKLPIFHFLSIHHLLAPIITPLIIKNKQYDLILSHGSTTTITAYTLKKFRNIPYITFIHDPMPYILEKVYAKTPLKFLFPIIKFTTSKIEKNLIKSSEYCVLDSKVHKNYILNSYKTNPEIVNLSIDPVDSTNPVNSNIDTNKKILSFGRWDRGKHPEILLDLALSIPKVKMIIAGNWTNHEDLKWFKNLILQKVLTNRIELITSFDEKSLQVLALQSFVWVHPHFEAFSLSALEAANLKLPIIIPKGSGVTELFENGIHGFFPKNETVDQLRKPTVTLFNNQKLAEQMGIAAAKIVEQNFSPQIRSLKLIKLITQALEAKTKIIALETAHVGKIVTAGGDLLLVEMAKRMNPPINLTVILPKIAASHWSDLKSAKMNILPSNYFESFTKPFLVFINYTIKSIQCFFILKKITKGDDKYIVYSSTDLLPDIIPAYFLKLLKPSVVWISRIHHLYPSPGKRPGNYFVNLISKLMQELALFLSKSKANVTVALNQNIQDELLKKGFAKEKTAVLQAGVNHKAIKRVAPYKSTLDAVYLGRIHKTKGVYDLVPIWHYVVNEYPKAKLEIIGTGSKEAIDQLKEQIKKSNLNKNISYKGYLNNDKVTSILKSSKIFLFVDHEAGFGLAAAQALACGLPIVGWDIGILGEVFEKGFVKTPLGDNIAYAKNVLMLLNNPVLQKKLSQEALAESKKHSWEKIKTDFEKIISIVADQT